MLKTASEVVAQGDLRAAVDFAIELNRKASSSKRELDQIKVYLRKRGREEALTGGEWALPCDECGATTNCEHRNEFNLPSWSDSEDANIELEGNLGVAFIVFPAPEARPRKGKDLRDAEANLVPETFAKLFTKTVVVKPVKDIRSKLDGLTAAEREVVDRFIEVVAPTPKVNLPR